MQLVMGIVSIIFGIAMAVLDSSIVDTQHYVGLQGYGIWIGAYVSPICSLMLLVLWAVCLSVSVYKD